MQIYDVLGIGFGPSNIALAIALKEKASKSQGAHMFFIEKQASFAWHRDMLLDNSHMQISFLKDLATLRNPTSRFTFISYLYEKNRLQDFINLKTFFPSRHEFNDYLSWAAAQFKNDCAYGEEVFEILPEKIGNEVVYLRIRSRDKNDHIHERLARNIVISVGGAASIPDNFQPFKNDSRIFHSSKYLNEISNHLDAKRIAIVGAGQSAAEIFIDLVNRPNAPKVDLIMRARAIKPSDDSPFVNEIFNTDFTDYVFNKSDEERSALIDEFWHTNYAAPDLVLIEQIFNVFYQQKVKGINDHRFLRRHEVRNVNVDDDGIHFTLEDLNLNTTFSADYDAVVLATGYRRDIHKSLLSNISQYLGDFTVDRDYRLENTSNFHPGIYLQGA